MFITPAAYLDFLPTLSGKTVIAQIVFSDGTRSHLVISKRQALEVAVSFLGISIDEIELLALEEQIHSSDLLPHDTELEKMVSQMEIMSGTIIRRIATFMKNYSAGSNS